MRNAPHWLQCLRIWSSAGDPVWEGLGGAALLEGVHQWRQELRLKASHISDFALSALLFTIKDVNSQFSALAMIES